MSSKLILGGNIRLNDDIFDDDPYFDPWGNTINITSTADVLSANLATTITDSKKHWPDKNPPNKLSSKYAHKLLDGNLNFLALGNNHILDYRKQGIIDTAANLNNLNINFTGAGMKIQSAQKFICYNINKPDISLKISCLSASNYRKGWAAGGNNEGIWYIDLCNWELYRSLVLERIQEVKNKCDVLVFHMQFNPNQLNCMKKFAQDIIKNGVDIIQGHSGHDILPLEIIYREIDIDKNIKTTAGIVFYSLGNFVCNYETNKKKLGALCTIDIDENLSKSISIFPIKIDNFQTNLLEARAADYQTVLDKLTYPESQ